MDDVTGGPPPTFVDDRYGLRATIEFGKADCDAPLADERVGMVGAELGLPPCERLLVKFEGLGWPSEALVAVGQVVHDHERVGVVRTELGLPPCERILVKFEVHRAPERRLPAPTRFSL